MRIKLDTAVTATLVVCAVVTTGAVVRQEFIGPRAAPTQVDRKPVLIPRWRDDLAKGVRLGPEAAPVQLIEFADFECPFCAEFHKTLNNVERRYPRQIRLAYIHYPISGHRFAIPAARAAECAGEQGRFEAMYDQLFDGQDQFGLRPWDDYAAGAGVPDIAEFDACIKKTDPIPRVEEGKVLGTKLDVHGTPTIVINGWKLGRPPTLDELDHMVKAILGGKSPVDAQ